MSRPLDYRGLLLFMAGHLSDGELLAAGLEFHSLRMARLGIDGPRARPAAACATCGDRGLYPELCPDCGREGAHGTGL